MARIILVSLAFLALSACGSPREAGKLSANDTLSKTDTTAVDTGLIIDSRTAEDTPDSIIAPVSGFNSKSGSSSEVDSNSAAYSSAEAGSELEAGSEQDADSNSVVFSGAEAGSDPEKLSSNDNADWIIKDDKQTTFGTVLITGESVVVHSSPGKETGILGRVHKGTVLALMQNGGVNGFYKVSYVGNAAYVPSDLSEIMSGEGVDVVSSGEKLIALTFDDGPNGSLTPQLLDILETENVYVTFFVLGAAAKAYPGIVKRAAEDGHEIGSHTWSHANLTGLSAGSLSSEIVDTADLIANIVGTRPSVTRPPYGEYNDMVSEMIETPLIMWSVDPMDWKFLDADTVFQNVVNVVKDGDIILLHDSNNTSVLAAERIIASLKSRGFTFVTVSELLARRAYEPQVAYMSLRTAASGIN